MEALGRRPVGEDADHADLGSKHVHHLQCTGFPGEAVERHGHARVVQPARHLQAEQLQEFDALLVRQRRGEDAGGRVQVVADVAAEQFLVLREGDFALDDARARSRPRFVGLLRVLGQLHRRTAVANGEVPARADRAVGAGLQFLLLRAVGHVAHQQERPRARLCDGRSGQGCKGLQAGHAGHGNCQQGAAHRETPRVCGCQVWAAQVWTRAG